MDASAAIRSVQRSDQEVDAFAAIRSVQRSDQEVDAFAAIRPVQRSDQEVDAFAAIRPVQRSDQEVDASAAIRPVQRSDQEVDALNLFLPPTERGAAPAMAAPDMKPDMKEGLKEEMRAKKLGAASAALPPPEVQADTILALRHRPPQDQRISIAPGLSAPRLQPARALGATRRAALEKGAAGVPATGLFTSTKRAAARRRADAFAAIRSVQRSDQEVDASAASRSAQRSEQEVDASAAIRSVQGSEQEVDASAAIRSVQRGGQEVDALNLLVPPTEQGAAPAMAAPDMKEGLKEEMRAKKLGAASAALPPPEVPADTILALRHRPPQDQRISIAPGLSAPRLQPARALGATRRAALEKGAAGVPATGLFTSTKRAAARRRADAFAAIRSVQRSEPEADASATSRSVRGSEQEVDTSATSRSVQGSEQEVDTPAASRSVQRSEQEADALNLLVPPTEEGAAPAMAAPNLPEEMRAKKLGAASTALPPPEVQADTILAPRHRPPQGQRRVPVVNTAVSMVMTGAAMTGAVAAELFPRAALVRTAGCGETTIPLAAEAGAALPPAPIRWEIPPRTRNRVNGCKS